MVFLDLNMPGLTGLEALPKLREALPDAKIVVLTTSQGARERAGRHGRRRRRLRPQADRRHQRPAAVREKLAA